MNLTPEDLAFLERVDTSWSLIPTSVTGDVKSPPSLTGLNTLADLALGRVGPPAAEKSSQSVSDSESRFVDAELLEAEKRLRETAERQLREDLALKQAAERLTLKEEEVRQNAVAMALERRTLLRTLEQERLEMRRRESDMQAALALLQQQHEARRSATSRMEDNTEWRRDVDGNESSFQREACLGSMSRRAGSEVRGRRIDLGTTGAGGGRLERRRSHSGEDARASRNVEEEERLSPPSRGDRFSRKAVDLHPAGVTRDDLHPVGVTRDAVHSGGVIRDVIPREAVHPGWVARDDIHPGGVDREVFSHDVRSGRRAGGSDLLDTSAEDSHWGREDKRRDSHGGMHPARVKWSPMHSDHREATSTTGGGRGEGVNRSGRGTTRGRNSRSPDPVDSPPRRDRRSMDIVRMPSAAAAKLPVFNGETSWEAFILKFENCAGYYGWTEKDRRFQIRNALEGVACHALSGVPADTDSADIIRTLRQRYGIEHQSERFRAELRNRRRRQGEDLRVLYNDVSRLMGLAYPGPTTDLHDEIGKEAFLTALNDPQFQVAVQRQFPKNLEEAYGTAQRFEAFEAGAGLRNWAGSGITSRTRTPAIRTLAVNEEEEQEEDPVMAMLRQLNDKVDRNRSSSTSSRGQTSVENPTHGGVDPAPLTPRGGATSHAHSVPTTPGRGGSSNFRGRGRGRGQYTPKSTGRDAGSYSSAECWGCGKVGHIRRDCPAPSANNTPAGSPQARGLQLGLATMRVESAVYLPVWIADKKVSALLDTGCEHSTIGSRIIPTARIQPTPHRLYSADGTEIKLLGETHLTVKVGGHCRSVTFLVSPNLGEAILGIDWLQGNECTWSFRDRTLSIGYETFNLVVQQTGTRIRRIYVTSEVVIPAHQMIQVEATVVWPSLEGKCDALLMEPTELAEGVVTARALISGKTCDTHIQIANLSDIDHVLFRDDFLMEAEPIDSDSVMAVRKTSTSTTPTSGSEGSSLGGAATSPTPMEGAATATQKDHLLPVFEKFPSSLTVTQRKSAEDLIRRYADSFSRHEFDLGRTKLVQHKIDTGAAKPFKQQLRRHPQAHQGPMEETTQKLLKNGIISPHNGPYASNVVLVRKTNGELRFCVDYRQLNNITVKDSYPLPRIDVCMDALGGAKYFSTLDMRSGYWQVELDEESAGKTAFVTRSGVYKFNVLPFGLSNAPAIFQRLMDMVLSGLTWIYCLAFLDDVIVMASTFEQHVERLTAVLDRLKEANLKLNPGKCHLFQEEVKFLGSIVSRHGVSPDPEKVRTVAEWPTPTVLRDVRAFVALAGYYRRHVKKFAEIARPLYDLMKDGVKFHWGAEQQEAFKKLKDCLISAPVMAMPADEGQYTLDTDASDYAVGAVLQQNQEGKEVVIAYASKTFAPAEVRYCTTRKELFAIVFGLKQFRHFLLGREIIIRTDHAALTSLMKAPEPVGQQARWNDLIAEYNFKIMHRAGVAHRNADGLSRRPCERDLGALPCRQCKSDGAGLYSPSDEVCLGNENERQSSAIRPAGTATTAEA